MSSNLLTQTASEAAYGRGRSSSRRSWCEIGSGNPPAAQNSRHRAMHRILWVDDDKDDLDLFCEAVRDVSEETRVIALHSGQDAVDFLEQNEGRDDFPCLMVLDMNMPGLSGRDTLARLRGNDRFSKLPIIVFTTSNSPLDRMFCDKFGVEMLTKPVEYATLRTLARKLLQVCRCDE
ncbi:MAG: response regulator [Chitinophagaceae bacterium]|nr:MAG: response regulator [Chitinophagaceae bacterium]